MRRLRVHTALPSPALQLLPLCLVAIVVLAPCSSVLAVGRWRGVAAPVVASPRVARRSSSLDDAWTPAEAYLSTLGLTDEELRKVRSRYIKGKRFDPDVDGKIKPIFRWLTNLGMADLEARKVVVRAPRILVRSLESNLQPTVQWLKDLGLDDPQVANAIAKDPSPFGLSLESNLKPTVQWLKDLGMDDSQVAKAIAMYPQLLHYSLGDNLNPKVQMLRERGFANRQIAKALSRFSQLVSYSMKRLTHRLNILEGQDRLTDTNLCIAMRLTDEKFAVRYGTD